MKVFFVRIHNILAWFLFAGSIVMFFLIALSVFGTTEQSVHAIAGNVLMMAAFLTAIVSLIIRVNKWNVILSIVVFLLLFPIQGILAYLDLPSAIRALHAVTGVLIMFLSYILANGFARAEIPEVDPETAEAAAD